MREPCLIATFLLILIQKSVEQSTNSQVTKYRQIEVTADSWNSVQISATSFSGVGSIRYYCFNIHFNLGGIIFKFKSSQIRRILPKKGCVNIDPSTRGIYSKRLIDMLCFYPQFQSNILWFNVHSK